MSCAVVLTTPPIVITVNLNDDRIFNKGLRTGILAMVWKDFRVSLKSKYGIAMIVTYALSIKDQKFMQKGPAIKLV
jgi:hypothetical protein